MQSNITSKKEKLAWYIAAGASLVIFLGVIGYSIFTAVSVSSQLDSIKAQESAIQKSVTEVTAVTGKINQCKLVLTQVNDAYDSYFSAFMGWTDQFEVMLNYGIFAADTVGFIAIPQEAAAGDDSLAMAQGMTCD